MKKPHQRNNPLKQRYCFFGPYKLCALRLPGKRYAQDLWALPGGGKITTSELIQRCNALGFPKPITSGV